MGKYLIGKFKQVLSIFPIFGTSLFFTLETEIIN